MDESDVKRLTDALERLPLRAVVAFAYKSAKRVAHMVPGVVGLDAERKDCVSRAVDAGFIALLSVLDDENLSNANGAGKALHDGKIARAQLNNPCDECHAREAAKSAMDSINHAVEVAVSVVRFSSDNGCQIDAKDAVKHAVEAAMGVPRGYGDAQKDLMLVKKYWPAIDGRNTPRDKLALIGKHLKTESRINSELID